MEATLHTMTGGGFLLDQDLPENIFTPEDFTEEQLLLRQSVRDFIQLEIEPRFFEIESEAGVALAPGLLDKAAALGFAGVGVPEEYGGYEADFRSQIAFAEIGYAAGSFGLTLGIQTSLGVAPLLLYGNKAQKDKYLAKIVSAEIKTCYCLTEPGAGSDANSGKTRALLSPDASHYVLNGQKMWITSSGHADLFFVFAKIGEDKNLSCFIVEKSYGGVRLGAEEKKMGIKGSSTRQVFFEDVPVPAENLLGERNGGFKIALNVLNTGRIKMSASVTGNAKKALGLAAVYARERIQFGQPIASFGAIQHKLAEMAAHIYAMESALYRVSGYIDSRYEEMIREGMPALEAKYRSIADFASECAFIKVYNTEALALVTDEALQIHGGMGYSAETKVECLYRNARIDRIYEGTNEINRMLGVEMILRKAMGGQLGLMEAVMAAATAPATLDDTIPWRGEAITDAAAFCARLRRAIMLTLATLPPDLLPRLKDEQEILLSIADMCIALLSCESALLRTLKNREDKPELRAGLLTLIAHRSAAKAAAAAKEILAAVVATEKLSKRSAPVLALLDAPPCDLRSLRRRVAERILSDNGYAISG